MGIFYIKEWKLFQKRRRGCLFAIVALTGLTYIGWFAYCHYYPLLLSKKTGDTSADIVNSEFHFGDVNRTHLLSAKKYGINPVRNQDQLQTKSLKKIASCDRYVVDHLTHSVPYLTRSSAELLEKIGSQFQASLKKQGLEKHRIIVTSVLRTGDDVKRLGKVNGNASERSAHQYATTFDITYVRYDRLSLIGRSATNKQLANILGNVLKQMRDEGRCYVKYERKQRCFHITSRQ